VSAGCEHFRKMPNRCATPSETIGRQIVGSCATRPYYARVGVAGPSPAPLRGFAIEDSYDGTHPPGVIPNFEASTRRFIGPGLWTHTRPR
jgi:hypothetical protein